MRKLTLHKIGMDRTGDVLFQIGEQSHRRENFTVNDDTFRASNGVEISSRYRPTSNTGAVKLYVKGANSLHDEDILKASPHFFELFEVAVEEYNEAFDEAEPWYPKQGEEYWVVAMSNLNFPRCGLVKMKRIIASVIAQGNFFKDREDARKALRVIEDEYDGLIVKIGEVKKELEL